MLQHLNVVTIIVVTKLLQRYNQIVTTFRPFLHGGGPAPEGQSPELQYLLRAVNKLSTFIQAALTNLWHESI